MDAQQAWILLAVSLGAFLIPLLARLVRISAAVGEVLYGFIIGPVIIGLIQPDIYLSFLGQLGFIVLMFMAGLEIDFNYVRSIGKKSTIICTIIVSISFMVAFILVYAAGWPLFTGLFLASISLGLPLAILRESGMSDSRVGQMVLLVGSIGEFLTIIVLTLFTVIATVGFSWAIIPKFLQLGALFLISVIILKGFLLFVWWKPEIFQKLAEDGDPQEIGMRLSMFIMLVFVGLAAIFNVKLVLGAFLAGAVLAFTFRDVSVVERKMSNLGFGFLVPIFFIQVGVDFNPQSIEIETIYQTVPLLIVLTLIIKLVPFIFLMKTGLTFTEAMMVGILLACPLTLMIAIAEVGLKIKVFDAATHAMLLLVAIILALFLPPLVKFLSKLS